MLKEIQEAELDLRAAMPYVKKCEEAMACVSKGDFAELKNLNNPPVLVKMVADLIALMFSVQPVPTFNPKTNKKEPDSWPAFKKFIAEPYVANKFLGYDTQAMSVSLYKKLKKRVTSEAFSIEKMKNVSNSCMNFGKWIIACVDFYECL